MLKYRLIFGTLMTALFAGLVLLDGRLDGSLLKGQTPAAVQGTILCILVALLAIPATLELASLAQKNQAYVFKIAAIPATILIVLVFYISQFFPQTANFKLFYVLFMLCGTVLLAFLIQAVRFGTVGVLKNCSATLFSVLYLGLLCSFVPAIRIDFGPWAFLMFVFTIKCSDIGAYTFGTLFGKHKMSPSISPGKTWEGLAGAIVFASATGYSFALSCGIMSPTSGVVFGAVFAILGQLGDLAESMLKRDAAAKDSSVQIPGFGGILDVIDSPLATAPAAYAFFCWCCGL
jgi:phosphatidate cytidylyltransferase